MRRRALLGTIGGVGLSPLAGCESTSTTPSTSSVPESRGNASAGGAAAPHVFDGGGTSAFLGALQQASFGSGVVSVAEGTHRLDPVLDPSTGGIDPHAEVAGLRDVTVEGNGATLVFTDPSLAGLHFDGGRDLTIRDLHLDYDPVPFTQGSIVDLAADRRSFVLALDDGFPRPDHEMFERANSVYTLIHRPDGEFIRGLRKEGNWDHHIASTAHVGGSRWRYSITDRSSTEGLREGRRLTVLARNNWPALSFQRVTRPVLENVTVHAANGGALDTTLCADPVYRNCGVHPPEGSPRQIGGNADGIRIINCRSSVTVEGCRHEYLGDDSLVVQNTMTEVTDIEDDRTVALAEWHPFVVGAGDELDVLSPTGVDKGTLPPIEHFDRIYTNDHQRAKPATITFAAAIADRLEPGDFVRNPATGSQNFVVRGNEFREHRANLIRIAASHGVVEDNVLVGCSIDPVELETDTSGHFSPKGWVRDVAVRNNRIARAGLSYVAGERPAGVHVHHRPKPGIETEGRPNRDIVIEGNDIAEPAALGVDVEAAEAVTIRENTIADPGQLEAGGPLAYGIGIATSRDVAVTDNEVSGSSDGLAGFGWVRESEAVREEANRLVVDGETSSASLRRWRRLTLRFSETVSWAEKDPGNADTRPLAFLCFELTLLDESGATVATFDVGNDADLLYHGGVYHPGTYSGETGRWFGGEGAEATLSLPGSALEAADRLRLRGIPMREGITMTVVVEGTRTDAVTFERPRPATLTLALG